MVLVSIGALGCKQSKLVRGNVSKREGIGKVSGGSHSDVKAPGQTRHRAGWRRGKLVSSECGQHHAAGAACEDSQGCWGPSATSACTH